MEQKTGLFGLDQFTISLICGVSVLSLVLVIVSLGIIGFFIKVGVQPFFCLSSTDQLNQSIHQTFLSSQFGWVISSGLTTVWEGYILGFGKKPVHNPRSPIQVKVQSWDITHTFSPIYPMVQSVTKKIGGNPPLNKKRIECFYGHPTKALSVYLISVNSQISPFNFFFRLLKQGKSPQKRLPPPKKRQKPPQQRKRNFLQCTMRQLNKGDFWHCRWW